MVRHDRLKFFALALLASCAPITAAHAQTTADGSANSGGEIVVTAQKRTESINNVGMAITALTGAQLKAQGVQSVADLSKIDPSFVFSQAQRGAPVYSIRGVGYNDFSLAASPTVSVYTDEAPYAYPIMTKGAAFDLDRVEVLKGPQGTVFGQNATGGAINYIAAKPTNVFRAGVEASYASYNATNFNGYISGPLTDTLKARLSFNTDEGGAWQKSYTRDDSLGAKDTQQIRLIADWTPTDKLKVTVNLNAWRDRSDSLAGQEIALVLQSPKFASFVPQVVNEPLAPANDRAADWLTGTHPRNNETFYQGSLRAEYKLSDSVLVTYLGTYENYSEHDDSENTGENTSFFLKLNGAVDYTSQELRFSGKLFDDRLDWLVGGNYSRAHTFEDQYENLAGSTSAYALTPFGVAPYTALNNVSTDVSEGKAIFGNVQYSILPNLDVHAGARYTETDIDHGGCTQDIDGNLAAGFTALESKAKGGVGVIPIPRGGCVTFGPTFAPGYVNGSLNQNNVSWRVGLDWKPIPKTLVYLNASKGYKSGSFPTLAASSYLQMKPVTQESILAYEAGVKTQLLENRLEIDADVFHYDYDNKQVEAREPDPTGTFGFLNVLLNVPKSTEYGAEFIGKVRPTEHLTLSARATYLDSQVVGTFLNYNPFSNTAINLQGQPFPNTPRWTTGFDAQYDWDLTEAYAAFVGGDVRYQSRSQGVFGADSAISQGFPSLDINAYTLLDLRAGLTSHDGHWRAEVFGNNVANTYYWTQAARPGEVATRFAGMPAVFGLRLGYSY